MSLIRKTLYALAAAALMLAVGEFGLRLAGFRYLRVTTDMEFNYPRPGFIKAFFELDPDLLYRIRSTVKQRYVELTWQPHLDLKIRGGGTVGPKPPGLHRIIALGDSSTYGVNTPRPWPSRLQERLDAQAGAGRYQVVNLGVPGYTAFQGRKVLETRGERLEPDVVVIYFGWNDHLLALGRADAQQRVGGSAVVSVRNTLARSRIYQALSWTVAAARGSASPTPVTSTGEPLRRVGPEPFRQELARLINLSRELGAQPILCTYPTAFQVLAQEGLPPPDWLPLTHVGEGATLADVLELQQRYNDIVRQVAAAEDAALVDLERIFAGGQLRRLFDAPDGDLIHPADAGYDLVAASVLALLPAPTGR